MRIFTSRGFGEPLVKKAGNDDMTEVQMDEFGDTETIGTDNVAENTESIATNSQHLQSSLDTLVHQAKKKERLMFTLTKGFRLCSREVKQKEERLTITQRSPFSNPSPYIKVLVKVPLVATGQRLQKPDYQLAVKILLNF